MTDDPAAVTKAALRRVLRGARRARTPDDVHAAGERICTHLWSLPEVRAASRLAAYVSGPLEPSTAALLDRCRAEGRTTLLPVVLPDLDLDWAVDDAAHRPGLLPGVHEPGGDRLGPDAVSTVPVVVVPALAVDRAGRRLGQGGGSYDRALARVTPGALVVALVHPDELLDGPLPTQPHDRPVDVVVSADGVWRVSRPA